MFIGKSKEEEEEEEKKREEEEKGLKEGESYLDCVRESLLWLK